MKLKIEQKKNPKTGKPMTVISNILHNPQHIEKLAGTLKSACGTGGSVQQKSIVLHGNHIDTCKKILENEGFTFI